MRRVSGSSPRHPESRFRYVYGPVPSRRLGLSLGLSVVPRKTCTLNCVYCQCGRTTRLTLERKSFYPVADILAQVRQAVSRSQPEFLTFSGEGEPTLNKDIGRLIGLLKAEFQVPVAVITNSTLMTLPEVRRALYQADLVVPSLDAADQRVFGRVNRNNRGLKVKEIIRGLETFRRYYKGRIWLEIMLVRGVNDSVDHLVKLRQAAARIRPDRIHLNTVVRPPAETDARPLNPDDLDQIRYLFGPTASVPESALPRRQGRKPADLRSAVVGLVRNRPVTKKDIEHSLGVGPDELGAVLRQLVRTRRVKLVEFWGKRFYEPG